MPKSRAQIIRDASGEPAFAVLPWADYRALAPDVDDAELSDEELAARAETAAEEAFPGEVVDRLLAGENPIRVFRELRGLTQAALAEAAGVAPMYVSQLERGTRTGSIETIRAIARVLRVDLDDLVG